MVGLKVIGDWTDEKFDGEAVRRHLAVASFTALENAIPMTKGRCPFPTRP
jgi:hypothetical protein